jgi:UDP-N-acetylmuramyl pentapeptide phosphotransferase/UDP-N-acetylglucosamine-1-phosphate transferase
MLLNFFLLAAIYASRKLGSGGYLVALAIGAVKGVIYLIATDDIGVAGLIAGVAAAVSCLIHYLLLRLTAKQVYVPRHSVPREHRVKKKVQWEYAPLTILFVAFVFSMP